MLTIAQLREAADAFAQEETPNWGLYTPTVRGRYEGVVKAKQRPRHNTKTGRAFTPAETRTCERNIAKWAKAEGFKAVTYPLAIRIEVIEPCPKNDERLILLSLRGATYNQKGDIDDYGKTILDALNGVAFKDDKQICDLHITRRYGRTPGFNIRIDRAGLNKSELINFRKMVGM